MSTDTNADFWDTLILSISMLPTPGLFAAVNVASFHVPRGLHTFNEPPLCKELIKRVRVALATWPPVVAAGSVVRLNFNQGLWLALKEIVAAPPQSTVVDVVAV